MAKETYPECDFCYYNLEFHNEISFLRYLAGALQAQPEVKQTNQTVFVYITRWLFKALVSSDLQGRLQQDFILMLSFRDPGCRYSGPVLR